jgi:hypothetical protein
VVAVSFFYPQARHKSGHRLSSRLRRVALREGIPGPAGILSCVILPIHINRAFFVKDFGFMKT